MKFEEMLVILALIGVISFLVDKLIEVCMYYKNADNTLKRIKETGYYDDDN